MNVIQLLLSAFLGGLIGLEREKHHKQSGIRTMALISLGACTFAIIATSFPEADPTRIIGQIITGIGFLGGGIIFKSGINVYGLTSSATIWCTAAIGVLVGVNMLQLAIILTLIILVVNSVIKNIN